MQGAFANLSEGVLDRTSSLKLAKATPQMSLYRLPARDYGGDFGGYLADMKAAQRPVRAKRMNVHVSNRVFRPDDVTKRQSGWLREILGPEGCPRTCFITVTKRSNAKKNKQSGARTDVLAGSGSGAGTGTGTGSATENRIRGWWLRRLLFLLELRGSS
jgi:hypothetical protein